MTRHLLGQMIRIRSEVSRTGGRLKAWKVPADKVQQLSEELASIGNLNDADHIARTIMRGQGYAVGGRLRVVGLINPLAHEQTR